MANPTTDRVSDERLAEILAWYVNWQPCAEDPGLSQMEADAISLFRELQRLRSPGGASDKFKGCVTCGSTEYPHDCNAPEPSERQPDGYAYRYPDGYIRFSGGREVNGSDPVETIPYYFRRAPEPRDEPLPPCSTCGGETVPFCTSCGYTTTKPAEYPAYTECQHDHMKPNPTLRATYPKHGSQSGWVQEYRCNVCQCSFERPIATAGLRANGETP